MRAPTTGEYSSQIMSVSKNVMWSGNWAGDGPEGINRERRKAVYRNTEILMLLPIPWYIFDAACVALDVVGDE